MWDFWEWYVSQPNYTIYMQYIQNNSTLTRLLIYMYNKTHADLLHDCSTHPEVFLYHGHVLIHFQNICHIYERITHLKVLARLLTTLHMLIYRMIPEEFLCFVHSTIGMSCSLWLFPKHMSYIWKNHTLAQLLTTIHLLIN